MKTLRLGLILMVVCVISAGSLAFVYLLTKPKIETNAKLALEKAKQEVLAGKKGSVVTVSHRGYAGPISMLVGIDEKGKVIKVKVLSQRETPGLGARVVEPGFLNQFSGKSLKDPIEPKKDIEAITGATISSRAVCNGVKEALKKK